MKRLSRILVLLFAFALCAGAFAQQYPNRPI
jgi:hypothetical protein